MYFRLRDISDESVGQQQSRKRSNSLPIPKIEVSLYQSNDLKKSEANSKDFIEVPEPKDVSLLAGKEIRLGTYIFGSIFYSSIIDRNNIIKSCSLMLLFIFAKDHFSFVVKAILVQYLVNIIASFVVAYLLLIRFLFF